VRILLVEDNKRLAESIAKGLRERAFAIDFAFDGETALYLAQINDYDLIILDIMIPAPDGLEVCRQLRKKKINVPILMLTARNTTKDKIEGLNTGADDYLVKPFEFGELLARIRALLRRRNTVIVQTNLEIADLIIDTNSQRVWREEKEIPLTAKEYCVLEFMAREKGRIVGRAEIAEHCWDEHFDVFSNIIDVYIKRLRAKIDKNFEVKLIHTRRGAGYIFDNV
jgi:two-component system copper resistance phosphate regulon response regulator CusR